MENKSSKHTTTVSLGFADALTIAFIVLKLCGVIDWPWLWVLSPLWISVAVVVAVVTILVIAGHKW